MNRQITARARNGWLAMIVAGLAGCGGNALYREGIDLYAFGKHEEALARLEQAHREAPKDQLIELSYRNVRQRIVGRLLGEALADRAAGRLDAAEERYRRVVRFDADNAEALAGITAVEQGRRHAATVAEARNLLGAGDAEAARAQLMQVLHENPAHAEARALANGIEDRIARQTMTPSLHKRYQTPVTLEFKDANLKQVLEALSRHSGLNFVVDKDVPTGTTVTVFLRNVTVIEALDLILSTNQLRQRVLNDTSVLIYPDNAAKLGDHQELIVRNFFLHNAEAKQVALMLRTVLKANNVFADDKLNLLIMRDTPAMVRLAEKLVSTQDVPEPEVMLEVAVMEVSRTALSTLGIQFPNQLSLTPLPASGTTLTLRDLQNLSSSRIGAAISPLVINLQDDGGATNLLANPRIRTHNREKALIRIGDRVPVITTTATSTGFVSESVQYVDVGLKFEVEPIIYPNNEIAIKLALEVSSVVKEVVSKAGSLSYQIGGRNASTVLRLKDGETQILGGLINDEDRLTANNFPGLSQLPMLGRLFSSEKDNRIKTELVLSITPRIVQGLAPPAQVQREFWSGTENAPRLRVSPASGEWVEGGKAGGGGSAGAGAAPLPFTPPGSPPPVPPEPAVPSAPAAPAAPAGLTPPTGAAPPPTGGAP